MPGTIIAIIAAFSLQCAFPHKMTFPSQEIRKFERALVRKTSTCIGQTPLAQNVETFRDTHAAEAEPRLNELQKVARERKNTFTALMEAGKVCSLGSMANALYDVGGEYRRNM